MEAVAHTTTPAPVGNRDDAEYDALLGRVHARFRANVRDGAEPLFTTDAEGLWSAFLDAIPLAERQYHTCHACRQFIERFGGLVTIDEAGRTTPAIWDAEDAHGIYAEPFAALARIVRRAKVTGVFIASEAVWGQPVTGIWRHLAVTPAVSMRFRRATQTAGQAMAEKREDFGQVMRALGDFSPAVLDPAVTLLKSESLYRSEKVLGQAEWLAGLHAARDQAHGSTRANVVWRAIAKAPAGFCHPRASMIGTLLEDLASGSAFDDVARRFAAKMHPLQYQRPQAAPKAGAIAAAEKVVEQLGAAGALARRFARVEEIEAIWRPRAPEPPTGKGVFGHLTPKGAEPSRLHVPATAITWEKFVRTALVDAVEIEAMVPSRGNFGAITTAENAAAPPILQWDSEDRRNPFAWYVYNGGSTAAQWSLSPSTWARVTALALRPSMWFGATLAHQGEGAVVVLAGARDTREAGSAIFPECLRSEFHGIRSVIEAYSRSARLGGREQASACGLMLHKGADCSVHLRVRGASRVWIEYRVDRWD